MHLIEITRADDLRLADYVALRESTLRRPAEGQGRFIAEGELVIRRALEAGYTPRSLLLAPRWVEGLVDALTPFPDVPVYVAAAPVVEQVTGFHVHRGALASMAREERHTVADLLARDRLVVVEDIVDHQNIGAIARTAAALGWQGLLLAPGAADPLYRRAIKVSMGAVFALPWARLSPAQDAIALLKGAGLTVVALALRPDAVTLDAFATHIEREPQRLAVLLGTEGGGLSDSWIAGADVVVRIPMTTGIDSLNVAAAAAVACYVLGSSGDSADDADRADGFSLGDTGQSSG